MLTRSSYASRRSCVHERAPSLVGVGVGPIGVRLGGNLSLTKVLAYVRQHGGGTIAVSSQSSAAPAIIAEDANVAGIGGFSGRESDVSVSWLAQEVRAGKIRWVLAEQGGRGRRPRLAGRHAHGLEGGDGRGGEGVHGGHAVHEREHGRGASGRPARAAARHAV